MTERLAEIAARIDGIRQLGAVVNAMRGVAAARAQQARAELTAVDSYAATIASAIGRVLAAAPVEEALPGRAGRRVLILFCAEQGFAGAFSDHVLDAVTDGIEHAALFVVGTRGRMVCAERGLALRWSGAMPAHASGMPRLADRLAGALDDLLAGGDVGRVETVFARWQPGRGLTTVRRRLLPLDPAAFAGYQAHEPPLFNRPAQALLADMTADYIHAQLCGAALHAFTAENEARMDAMAAARGHIDSRLAALQASQRIIRQDEITGEIVELAAGESASRAPAGR